MSDITQRWRLPADLTDRFEQDGYVVVRQAVPAELCRRAVAAFEQEVKPARRTYFLRHESSKYEFHVFTTQGFMKYPIMNLQDLPADRFPGFCRHGLDILAHPAVQEVITVLLGEPGRCIHTMFFDGNQRTWAHRDSHYIDSERTGTMLGLWVAAEDIHPGAGRFYVYAGSHRVATPSHLGLDGMDANSRLYKDVLAGWLERSGLPQVAPELRCGDALLWNSLTIHGSLPTEAPDHSRKSFTAHYIPQSHEFLWARRLPGSQREIVVNGMRVARHKDQGAWPTQAKAWLREALLGRPALWRGAMALKSLFKRG